MGLNKEAVISIYQSIAAANEERNYEYFHASSIYICPRAHIFKRLGVKSLTRASGAKVIRWGAGHQLEEELRPHVDKVWGGTTANIRLTSKKLDFTGEYDNFTKDGHTLIEVKSVSDWAFYKGPLTTETVLKKAIIGQKNKWGKPAFEPMNEPYLHHQLQNHGYVALIEEQKLKPRNIDYVYASLSGLLCVYHTEVNPIYLKWVKDRLALLKTALATKTLPDCLCDNTESPLYSCSYQWCDYKTNKGCCDESLLENVKW